MPRVTLQHEQQVRGRILAAALRVFGARGFRRSTMQDVVRESDDAMADWNAPDVASASDGPWKSATKLLRPAENDSSSRVMTLADSEPRSSHPPELSSSAARETNRTEPSARRRVTTATMRRKR